MEVDALCDQCNAWISKYIWLVKGNDFERSISVHMPLLLLKYSEGLSSEALRSSDHRMG